MIADTLEKLHKAIDPDLSVISSRYFATGSRLLRRMAPLYIANKDYIVDIKYKVDSITDTVIRPLFAKSGFSTIDKDRINVLLEERTHEVKMDSQQMGENQSEMESVAISGCTYPVIESLVREMGVLLTTNANYVADREVDVDATGTPANDWAAPTTCTPLTDVRNALDKFYASATVTEDDPNTTIIISPYLAKLLIDSDEYKTEVGTKKIIEPILKEDKLKTIFGKNVILTDGYYYGENGTVMFDRKSTCYILYIDNPTGSYTDIQRFSTNNSTFLVGCRNLELPNVDAINMRINDDELFRLSGTIIGTWMYTGNDKVTTLTMKSLMRSTVWIHDIKKLVRLVDITV